MFKKISEIPKDKILHFTFGMIIYLLANSLFIPLISFIIVIILASGKEIYDKLSKKGTPDVYDALVTVLGGMICLVLTIL